MGRTLSADPYEEIATATDDIQQRTVPLLSLSLAAHCHVSGVPAVGRLHRLSKGLPHRYLLAGRNLSDVACPVMSLDGTVLAVAFNYYVRPCQYGGVGGAPRFWL